MKISESRLKWGTWAELRKYIKSGGGAKNGGGVCHGASILILLVYVGMICLLLWYGKLYKYFVQQ